MKRLFTLLLINLFSFGLIGCQKEVNNKQKIDEAVEKIKAKIEDTVSKNKSITPAAEAEDASMPKGSD